MAGLVDSLYKGFQNTRFKPVIPPLAIDSVAQVPGLRIGLPWPWTQSPDVEAPRDTEPILEVVAPRTDQHVSFVLWRELEASSLEPIIKSAGAQIARLYQGRLTVTRKVVLHGARGVLVAVDDPHGDTIWRLVAEWGNKLVHGEMRLPASSAAGYAPHLDTMLGTWEWGG